MRAKMQEHDRGLDVLRSLRDAVSLVNWLMVQDGADVETLRSVQSHILRTYMQDAGVKPNDFYYMNQAGNSKET